MLTTIKGIYSNGQIVLSEQPPTNGTVEVLVTFTGENSISKSLETLPSKQRKSGFAKDYITYIAPDFDDPIDSMFNVFE